MTKTEDYPVNDESKNAQLKIKRGNKNMLHTRNKTVSIKQEKSNHPKQEKPNK